jgi:hypothetical protein
MVLKVTKPDSNMQGGAQEVRCNPSLSAIIKKAPLVGAFLFTVLLGIRTLSRKSQCTGLCRCREDQQRA